MTKWRVKMLVYLIKMKDSWGNVGDDDFGVPNRRWLPGFAVSSSLASGLTGSSG
jgi:hypothetical protein